MNNIEQGAAFARDLEALVNRYRREFDLTYAQIIGFLHMEAYVMCAECSRLGIDNEESD